MTTEQKHAEIVRTRCKSGMDVALSWLTDGMNSCKAIELLHAAIGIGSESGEIQDTIKKVCIYGQPMAGKHHENLIEELGDLEFYMQELRSLIGVTREETLLANIAKLEKRYPEGYSDEKAKERKDKQ